jgi:hypothetical protein
MGGHVYIFTGDINKKYGNKAEAALGSRYGNMGTVNYIETRSNGKKYEYQIFRYTGGSSAKQ